MAEAGCPLPRHNLREVIERYAGLCEAVSDAASNRPGQKAVNFLQAAGHPSELGAVCLSRRERTRLLKHLDDSRQSFLALFDQLDGNRPARTRAIRRGVELALTLSDFEAANRLGILENDLESPVKDGSIATAGISIGRTAATID